MEDNQIPANFPIPFASGAGAGYVRAIPEASQIGIQNGAASLTDGFPPNCFIPVEAGGSWPFGQDFNGVLQQITAWLRWLQAGAPVSWDSAFSTAIGGYPYRAVVASTVTPGLLWRSTVDNNTTNPDTGGAGWVQHLGRVAPQVATSAQGVILGASYSGSESVTFTAPVAGYVYAWGTLNLNVVAGATVLCNLVVNGTTVQYDSTELSQSHQAVVAVTAGESVTVALQVSTGANPSVSATYSVGASFQPYP